MPAVGEVLADRYRIESVLGVGGMASVYRATDLRLDRQVAVKVLAANLAADAQFADRFSSEAGAMAGFNHPNIASVFDVEPGDPAIGREPFYVMEYCEGGSLADRLHDAGRISPAELVPTVTAIAEALAELQRGGIIHRDVKPANILFAGERPKLADFGVARIEDPLGDAALTQAGSVIGTAPYLAPEVIAGAPATAASDVYSLGVTIFRALTGQYPQPSTGADPNGGAGRGPALPVSAVAPDLGRAFDAAVATALDADPRARPAGTELAAQLAAGLDVLGIAKPNPGAFGTPSARRGGPSGEDGEARTVVAPPSIVQPVEPIEGAEAMEPAASPPAAGVRPPAALGRPVDRRVRPARRTGWIALAMIAIVLMILAIAALPRLQGGGGVSGGSAVPSTAPSASGSASAPPTGSDAVLAALGQVDAAIEAARGGKDGLTGRDANDLAQLAASVRGAVQHGDLGAAATAARALADRARALAASLDPPRRNALLAAIDGLSAALAAP